MDLLLTPSSKGRHHPPVAKAQVRRAATRRALGVPTTRWSTGRQPGRQSRLATPGRADGVKSHGTYASAGRGRRRVGQAADIDAKTISMVFS